MTEQASKPDVPVMTGAELMATREFLGMSRSFVAKYLVLNERRLQRMENGEEEIPDALVAMLDRALDDARILAHDLISANRRDVRLRGPDSVVFIQTYRNTDDYPGKYCPGWHRMVCARVMESVPGLALTYGPTASCHPSERRSSAS